MNSSFRKTDTNGIVSYACSALNDTGLVRHAFSTRIGGKSEGGELNLGMHTSDIPETVLENYQLFCDGVGIDCQHLVLSQQVHSDNIAVVTTADRGKGLVRDPENLIETDGLITADRGVALATFYADCTPFLMLDPVNHVIASVHSGWRGTLSRIGRKAVRRMQKEFGCRPENIIIAIGPSIMQCHFEVDEDVKNLFLKEFGPEIRPFILAKNEKFYINTQAINMEQFMEVGVDRQNLHFIELCTYCHRDQFFSYRGDHGNTGRLCAVIELK